MSFKKLYSPIGLSKLIHFLPIFLLIPLSSYGQFEETSSIILGDFSERLKVVDLDNDGDLDIIRHSHWITGGPLRYALNQNNGSEFDVAIIPGSENLGRFITLETADFNNDGLQDIFFITHIEGFDGTVFPEENKMGIYYNLGNGKFKEVHILYENFYSRGDYLKPVFIDFNNDTYLDILLPKGWGYSTNRNYLNVLINKGPDNKWETLPTFEHGFAGNKVYQEDLDKNGINEILVNCKGNLPSPFYSRYQGLFAFQPFDSVSGVEIINEFSSYHFADFDKDGDQDILADQQLYENLGELNFTLRYKIGSYKVPDAIAVADFDNDGDPDIICNSGFSPNSKFDHNYMYLENIGAFRFREVKLFHISDYLLVSGFNGAEDNFTAKDLDNDGMPDLVFNRFSGGTSWRKNNLTPFKGIEAFFEAPENLCFEDTLYLEDLSRGKNIVSRYWDFGDGDTSTERYPSHFYKKPGQYTLSFTVENLKGETHTLTKQIEILSLPEIKTNTHYVACGEETEITLTIDNPTEGSTYNWYSGEQGGEPHHTGTSFTTIAYYKDWRPYLSKYVEEVNSNGCRSKRQLIKIFVYPIPEPPAIDDVVSFSGPNELQFKVKEDTSATYYWYRHYTDLEPFHIGTTFSNFFTSDTAFYVAKVLPQGCKSPLAKVHAYVHHSPPVLPKLVWGTQQTGGGAQEDIAYSTLTKNSFILGHLGEEKIALPSDTLEGKNNEFLLSIDQNGNYKSGILLGNLYPYESSFKVDLDGNIIVAGFIKENVENPTFLEKSLSPNTQVIAKLTQEGELLWIKEIKGASFNQLITDHENNILVEGHRHGEISYNGKSFEVDDANFILKIDSDGNLLWSFGFATLSKKQLNIDSKNNVYLTGVKIPKGIGNPRPFDSLFSDVNRYASLQFKLDNKGNFQNISPLGYFDIEKTVIRDDYQYFLGKTYSYIYQYLNNTPELLPSPVLNDIYLEETSIFIQKASLEGKPIWTKTIEGEYYQTIEDFKVDSTGNVFLLLQFGLNGESLRVDGYEIPPVRHDMQSTLLKFDNNGKYRYSLNLQQNEFKAMTLDRWGNPIIHGHFLNTIKIDTATFTAEKATTYTTLYYDRLTFKLGYPITSSFIYDRRLLEEGIQFYNNSLAGYNEPIISFMWDFGDGETSTDANPLHIYKNEGTYEVSLTIRGQQGTENTFTQEITASDDISDYKAYLNYNTHDPCNPRNFNFQAQTDYTGSVNQVSWFVNGASISNSDSSILELENLGLGDKVKVEIQIGTETISDSTIIEFEVFNQPIIRNSKAKACVGESTTLTAYGNYVDFEWSNGARGSSITPIQGTYTVRGLNKYGCWSEPSEPIKIESPILEAPEISAEKNIGCIGESIQLTAPVGYVAYQWSDGETNPNRTVYQSGSYSLKVQNELGCWSEFSAPTEIIFEQLTTPEISTSAPEACNGDAIELNAPEGFVAYEWSNGETSPTLLVSAYEDLRVRVQNDAGCWSAFSAPATYAFSELTQPKLTASSQSPCVGETVTLTAPEGFAAYHWNTGESTSAVKVSENGDYSVKVMNEQGCWSEFSNPATIAFLALPQVEILYKGLSACEGELINLSAPAGYAAYEWSTGETSSAIQVAEAGEYQVRVQNEAGCWSDLSAAVQPEFFPLAIPTISSSASSACFGDKVQLQAPTGFAAYEWSNGATVASIDATNSGDYAVRVMNDIGCWSEFSAPATITFTELPQAEIHYSGLTACEGDLIELTAPAGYAAYEWSTGETSAAIQVAQTGDYKLRVQNEAGCWSAFSPVVRPEFYGLSAPTITSSTSSACVGDKIQLQASAGFTTYEWSNGATTASINVTSSGDYTVRVMNDKGCWSSLSEKFIVNFSSLAEKPLVEAPFTEACIGDTLLLKGPAGYVDYQWSNGVNSSSLAVVKPGNYKLKVMNEGGCWSEYSDHVSITFNDAPEAFIIHADDYYLYASLGSAYAWYKDGVLIAGENGSYILSQGPGEYQVEVFSYAGCSSLSSPYPFQIISGINEEIKDSFSIYPNPAKDGIWVKVKGNLKAFTIYTSEGQLVNQGQLTNKENFIDLQPLSSGLYYLKITTQEDVVLTSPVMVL